MTTATAASPTHTPTGADYRPSSSWLSPATDATTDDEDASAPSKSGRPPSASGDAVDSSIGAACAGRYWTAASARRRGGARRACLAATRVAALSMLLPLTHQVWALGAGTAQNCSERGSTAQQATAKGREGTYAVRLLAMLGGVLLSSGL